MSEISLLLFFDLERLQQRRALAKTFLSFGENDAFLFKVLQNIAHFAPASLIICSIRRYILRALSNQPTLILTMHIIGRLQARRLLELIIIRGVAELRAQ